MLESSSAISAVAGLPSADSPLLTEAQAARYLGVCSAFLHRRRVRGNMLSGPPWIKVGSKVAYLRNDLDAWLRSQRHTVAEV